MKNRYITLKTAKTFLENRGYSKEVSDRDEILKLIEKESTKIRLVKEPEVKDVYEMLNHIVSDICAQLESDLNPAMELESKISNLVKELNAEQVEQMYCNFLNQKLIKVEQHKVKSNVQKNVVEKYIELLNANNIEHEIFTHGNDISVATKNADDNFCEELLKQAQNACSGFKIV